jgi:arylsulfatase A-like enzyme
LLIAKPRRREREDVYEPTSCVDLLPTLLHITGKAIPDWCEGNLLPSFGDNAARGNRAIFAVEAKSNPKQAPLTKGTVALVKDQHKLIHYFGYDGYESEYELYDLTNDPEELEDVYTSKKSIAEDLKDQLAEKLRQVNQQYV